MKTHIMTLFCPPVLRAALALILAGPLAAQTFTTLYSFTGGDDGWTPDAGLILSGNTLYGTSGGGSSSNGTVFAVNTDGTGFTTHYSFSGGSDGAGAGSRLLLSGNTLYGTAGHGGTVGNGTVFALNTDGTGFMTLYSFKEAGLNSSGYHTNSDGTDPQGGLILSGKTLYGTAGHGGNFGFGTVFALNTDGTGFTTLHTFTGSDGGEPRNGLLLSGNTLYGTAPWGSNGSSDTVFAINTDGTGFTTLHRFTAGSGFGLNITNSDGAHPSGRLLLSGSTLYGTAFYGGSSANGTVFKLNTDGTGFTMLHTFTPLSAPYTGTNSDGAHPHDLILWGNTLYGTAQSGGSSASGTVFALNTDGTGFTTLYSFTATSGCYPCLNSDGFGPYGGVILSGSTLYGTAGYGGSFGFGTVFSLSITPPPPVFQMPIQSGNTLTLTWSALPGGAYQVQFKTDLMQTNWANLGTALTATNTTASASDTLGADPQRFYRVVALPYGQSPEKKPTKGLARKQ